MLFIRKTTKHRLDSILIYLLVIVHLCNARVQLLSKQERENIFGSDYDPLLSPVDGNKPVEVGVKVYVINIRSVKEPDLSLIMDIFLHQFWRDPRLKIPRSLRGNDRIILDSSYRTKLWIPETFFKNSISGTLRGVLFPSLYFTMSSTKEVFMAARASLSLTCDMKFHNYPHDVQRCYLDLMSLTNTNETVHLKWLDFKMTSNLYLTRYKIGSYSMEDCTRTYEIGSFSCLRGVFELERLVGHHIIKLYIPSILIVVMTFVGYYIPVTAYPARVTLNVTALLSLITLQLHITSTIQTTYIVSINIWMIICTAFVFAGLIEYAIAIVYAGKAKTKPKSQVPSRSGHRVFVEEPPIASSNDKERRQSLFTSQFFKSFFMKVHGLEDNPIDSLARKVFPIAFVVLLILYIFFVSMVKFSRTFS